MSHQNPAEESSVEPQVHFPGELFAQAREDQGLSLATVAAELHLSKLYLHAIETADFERIRNPVFARGYIRTYARFLKLDGEAMVAAYDASQGHHAGSAQVKSVDCVQQETRLTDPLIRGSLWLAAIVVIGITFWWWKAQNSADTAPVSAVDNAPVVVETVTGDELALVPDAPEPVIQDDQADTPVMPEPEVVADPEVAEIQIDEQVEPELAEPAEPVQTAAESVQAADTALEVLFSADCWLEVRNEQNRIVFSGVKKAGETLRLNSSERYALKVGNMSGVEQILFAGTAVDLSPYAGHRVARIELPNS